MYRNILLAYDGSREGREALDQGAVLARMCGADVFLLAVVDRQCAALADGTSLMLDMQEFETTLEDGLRRLRARGLRSDANLKFGDPAEQIAQSAREMDADLIVLGHRSQTAWSRLWNGSVGLSVVKQAPCSVLVAVAATEDRVDRGAPPPSRKKGKVVTLPLSRNGGQGLDDKRGGSSAS